MTVIEPLSAAARGAVPASTGSVRAASLALVSAVAGSHRRLGGAVAALTDAQVEADSRLPGWTRGHVLAHLTELATAVTHQIESARSGELVDLYDGGQPARDAAIAAGASALAVSHVRALRRATAGIDVLLSSLAPADWKLPVRFHDGVVRTMALAWWREVEFHLADLDLGPDSGGWSLDFCDHAADFLAARVPDGTLVVLESPDGWVRRLGAGAPRVVRGQSTDLVAWLAGRQPVLPVSCDGASGLPLLGPWPQRSPLAVRPSGVDRSGADRSGAATDLTRVDLT